MEAEQFRDEAQRLCSDLIDFLNQKNMGGKPATTLFGLTLAMVTVVNSERDKRPKGEYDITEALFSCTQDMPKLLGAMKQQGGAE